MVQKCPGLILKNKCFYFRHGLPKQHWTLARCKEIGYSLNTTNYNVAVGRWKTEFTHLQTFLSVFESIVMKINENNKVVLNETDVDKILLYRLGQIQHFLEENAPEIENGKIKFKDIQLTGTDTKNLGKIQKLMIEYIINYLKGLVDSNQANVTLRTVYSKLRDKEVELGIQEQGEDGDQWFKSFNTHVVALDKYASYAIKAMKEKRTYSPSNPKVKTLLRTYDTFKTNERLSKSIVSTPWDKFFKKFALYKQNIKGTSDSRIYRNKQLIELAFLLMKKENIEDVTKQDCRRLSELIHRVPKRWMEDIKEGQSIHKILTDSKSAVLSKKTIQSYLQTFKEFMRFAEREDIINNDMNNSVDVPIWTDPLIREPFTSDELRQIFNPQVYASPKSRKHIAKFWVPLIALYNGCRLNEICQMDLEDILIQKQIPCFSINHNAPDKTTKNEGSVRIIPIHPVLIELGFMNYVRFQQRQKERKLFSELKRQKRGLYGRSVQSWFARHLDKIGIPQKSKVFHSFRHTYESKAVECKIPTEYQNALGGWRDYGVGQRVYGKKKDIRLLYGELSKITYPIHKELKEFRQVIKTAYFMKD